jgi:solute carrier family 32 (vesicular inhibitory amino acid transporter)
MLTAGLFITGEMSGTGVLALPSALSQSHWFGVAMIVISCILSCYCGIRLSSCWKLILKNDTTLHSKFKGDPFPFIAYTAAGNIGK